MKRMRRIDALVVAALVGFSAPACGDKEKPPEGQPAKVEAAKPEAPKAEAPKPEAPKAEAPKPEAPKAEAPKAEPPKTAAATPPVTAAATPPVTAAAPAAPAPPAGNAKPGPIYLAVDDVGLVKMDAGKFEVILKEPDKSKEILVQPDGTMLLAAYTGTFEVKPGGTPNKIGDFKNPGSVEHLAAAPDGTLWTASFKGVAQYKGGAWVVEEKEKLGQGVTLLKDIAVDKEGTVWVASSNALHMRKADVWTTVEHGQGDKLFFAKLAVGQDGTLYLSHSSGVLKGAGGKFEQLNLGGRFTSPDDLAVDGSGTLHIGTYKDVVRVTSANQPTRFSSGTAFKGQKVEALTADQNGRTWLFTDYGLVMLDAAGKATEWPPGSVAELAGTVRQLVAVGGGPEQVPPVGVQRKGSISGTVIKTGAPVVGATVEVCKRPSSLFKTTPCGEAPFKQSAKTDATGRFSFADVPLDTYRFAIEDAGKWATGWNECCQGMKEGQSFDVGSITLKDK
jgi:hypothetical protein